MLSTIIRTVACIAATIYVGYSLFVHYDMVINTILFIGSFIVFAFFVGVSLIKNGNLPFFHNAQQRAESIGTNYFWIYASLTFYIGTVFIAVFHEL
ncbi:hypothetical protein [Staphylococcus sp. HMSC056G08]|uniref:hypothetical protein n=1 Tax=Staphylococcus sp. HMSC056G08 TaxID=1739350 RepID=UPI0008A11953|nr:hypothetical protein [Staphylococcus sp. HMSC056G08]OFJ80801.1 hypothetical protein HMPREF2846_04065 [Staphylococcus sp. HMSC056G08]